MAAAPDISIILPVYQAVLTLDACLRSLESQESADIEIVCVDDGSTDGSAAVLAEHAASDARVRVITQENAGVSVARNVGLGAARGRIIMFIDADDRMLPGAFKRVLEAFDAGRSDGVEAVAFGARCEPEEAAPKHVRNLLSPAACVLRRGADGYADPDLLFCANAQPYIWRLAVSRDLLEREGILFTPGLALGEDAVFMFAVYATARATALIPDKLYGYRMEAASATHQFNAEGAAARKLGEHLRAQRAILEDWRVRGLLSWCPGRMITWCLDFLLFDIARLPETGQREWVAQAADLMAEFFGDGWTELPANVVVRRTARKVAAGYARFSKAGLVLFFIATRGLRQCVERFI